MACTLCWNALPAGEWCRACGEGRPAQPVVVKPTTGPLFDGTGCGHPTDPVATRWQLNHAPCWVCHCGELLDPANGRPVDAAPGPVVFCQNCGCHVAVPLEQPR